MSPSGGLTQGLSSTSASHSTPPFSSLHVHSQIALILFQESSDEEEDEEEEEEEKPAPTPAAKKQKTEVPNVEDDGNVSIFIKNLPWKVTEDDVAEFFADCGEVSAVRLGELFETDQSKLLFSISVDSKSFCN